MELTTDYWRERKLAGLTRVSYVGMSRTIDCPGIIKRVSSGVVHVLLNGDPTVSCFHPDDIRPR
ncbi:hypothetical protein QMG61_15195 [Cryobacterium sp. PH31-AA6]|uniref:hypothetical protein n=1 Tax=Cryobacterium sp. PH31-AA6 TaxID=3046205 RepID=UPI0024BADF10|nr:hypothetical protein [Cryobacterium sp. PH31-AA6]MDJ0325110.1 hypothetical protein [Cryobacterium sp. PH31-AA6]